jgi:hypothetical protein
VQAETEIRQILEDEMTHGSDKNTENMDSISIADGLLMQNLLWLLISEGVVSKDKISGMIAGCAEALNGVPNPNQDAIQHLETIQEYIDRGGQPIDSV